MTSIFLFLFHPEGESCLTYITVVDEVNERTCRGYVSISLPRKLFIEIERSSSDFWGTSQNTGVDALAELSRIPPLIQLKIPIDPTYG